MLDQRSDSIVAGTTITGADAPADALDDAAAIDRGAVMDRVGVPITDHFDDALGQGRR